MSNFYKHSVKGSLTRKLVLIIVFSVIILYAVVIVVQTTSSTKQSGRTKENLDKLSKTNFRGELQSRSGQVSQKLQMYINFLQNLNRNLKLLFDGTLPQAQSKE